MKTQTAILTLALAAAFAAPAFASYSTTTGAKAPEQLQASKKGPKKPSKSKTPKAPKNA